MISEKPHVGGYILRELPGLSRDDVTLSGGNYGVGDVMGKVTDSGHYVRLDPAAKDGSEVAAAILFAPVKAAKTDLQGVISARLTAVKGNALLWPDKITDEQKTKARQQLLTHYIVIR